MPFVRRHPVNIPGPAAIFALPRRDARVVEWDGLENRCTGNCTEGSNPSLSANSAGPVLRKALQKAGVCD
jgi:hypothetical protein